MAEASTGGPTRSLGSFASLNSPAEPGSQSPHSRWKPRTVENGACRGSSELPWNVEMRKRRGTRRHPPKGMSKRRRIAPRVSIPRHMARRQAPEKRGRHFAKAGAILSRFMEPACSIDPHQRRGRDAVEEDRHRDGEDGERSQPPPKLVRQVGGDRVHQVIDNRSSRCRGCPATR